MGEKLPVVIFTSTKQINDILSKLYDSKPSNLVTGDVVSSEESRTAIDVTPGKENRKTK